MARAGPPGTGAWRNVAAMADGQHRTDTSVGPHPVHAAARRDPGRAAGHRLRDHPLVRPGRVGPDPGAARGGGVSGGGLIVEGPQPGWNPEQVVSGFLLASASFAHHHATAREYLTPSASRLWRPGAQVTIPASTPIVYQQPGRLSGQGNQASVEVSWQELATLDASGQYTARGGADPPAGPSPWSR